MLTVGTRVRIEKSRFSGKEGTIVVVNHERFDPNRKQSPKLKWRDESIEYGVAFGLKEDSTEEQIRNGRADAWFVLDELEPITKIESSG